jgi:hypothetical protein
MLVMIPHSVFKAMNDGLHGARAWGCGLAVSLFILTVSVGSANATAPSITSLSVSSGPVGTSVTITGTNFGSPQGTSYVKVNGATVTTYSSWSTTSIKIQVPAAATTSGNVVVTVTNQGSSNGKPFTVTPAITSLSLTTGPQKMGFVISGTTFGSTQGSSTAMIGTTALTVEPGGWSSTAITVQVPTTAATGSVVVTVANNASNSKTFTVATYGCP